MLTIETMALSDSYKQNHEKMYAGGTTLIYSNMTPRKSRLEGCKDIVVFGVQYFIKEVLIDKFKKDFFDRPLEEVLRKYKRLMDNHLGKDCVSTKKLVDLHNLGYIPLKIKCLPEGTLSPIGIPFMTIVNTLPQFYWLTNFVESILSAYVWGAITSATISKEYRKLLNKYAIETVGNTDFVQWQGHCFAMRGMMGLDAIMLSGAGHALSFTGSDSIPTICWLEEYYNADCEKELIIASVPASEHSISCSTAINHIESIHSMEEFFNEETQEWEFSRFISDDEIAPSSR